MKKLLLIAFIILITNSFCQAQPYSNYINNTVRWHSMMSGWSGYGFIRSYFTEYINGDTLINNTYYFKLYSIGRDTTFGSFFDPNDTTVRVFKGGPTAIREDSLKRFFRYNDYNQTESEYENFNIAIGDTFRYMPNCTVNSIDSLYLGIKPLKRFKPVYMPSFSNAVVEGIGTTGPVCGMGIEGNSWIACYHKDGIDLLLDTNYRCDQFDLPSTTSIDVHNKLPSVRLFPNPSFTYLTVEIPGNLADVKMNIYNSLGAVKAKLITTSLYQRIDISEFESGLYVLEIIKGDEIQRIKFIKAYHP